MELFVSTERILVLNTDLQEIMMDHSLRTISYIADIGDIVVLMARRNRSPSSPSSEDGSGAGGNGAMAADLAAKRQQHKMVRFFWRRWIVSHVVLPRNQMVVFLGWCKVPGTIRAESLDKAARTRAHHEGLLFYSRPLKGCITE